MENVARMQELEAAQDVVHEYDDVLLRDAGPRVQLDQLLQVRFHEVHHQKHVRGLACINLIFGNDDFVQYWSELSAIELEVAKPFRYFDLSKRFDCMVSALVNVG